MTILSTQELTAQFPHVLDRLADGEEFAIATEGIIIGRLLPPIHPRPMPSIEIIDRANARLFASTVHGTVAGGIDNAGIDRDLTGEYDSSHD